MFPCIFCDVIIKVNDLAEAFLLAAKGNLFKLEGGYHAIDGRECIKL